MNRNEVENLYIQNGLRNYHLNSVDDLLKVHGVDHRVKGYENLTEANRTLYEQWLVCFFNRQGMGTRMNLVPDESCTCQSI